MPAGRGLNSASSVTFIGYFSLQNSTPGIASVTLSLFILTSSRSASWTPLLRSDIESELLNEPETLWIADISHFELHLDDFLQLWLSVQLDGKLAGYSDHVTIRTLTYNEFRELECGLSVSTIQSGLHRNGSQCTAGNVRRGKLSYQLRRNVFLSKVHCRACGYGDRTESHFFIDFV